MEQNDWEKGIGFDAGKTGRSVTVNPSTDEQRFNNLLANSNSCDVPEEAPAANITGVIRDAWNYLYLHNPNINLYRGTFDEFRQRTFTETELKQKWVCRSNGSDDNNYKLKRYDFCERQWVDAGLWNASTHAYDAIDIRYYEGMNWSGMSAAEQNDHAAVVAKFKSLLIAEAYPTEQNQGIGLHFKVSSLRFHYAFINLFIAGTDNCSKNTYYVIDPETHKIELHQDDVDTVLATDNYGYQTKPYYIDRKHPYPDGSNVSGYDGMNNGLFDLVERQLVASGVDYEIFDDLPAEPSYMDVQKVIDQFKHIGADFVVACGGGSVMDAAKGRSRSRWATSWRQRFSSCAADWYIWPATQDAVSSRQASERAGRRQVSTTSEPSSPSPSRRCRTVPCRRTPSSWFPTSTSTPASIRKGTRSRRSTERHRARNTNTPFPTSASTTTPWCWQD